MILLAKQLKITTLHVSSPLHKIGWEPSQVVLLHDVGGHLFPLDEQDVAKCDQIFLGGRRHVLPIGPRALHGSLVAEHYQSDDNSDFCSLDGNLEGLAKEEPLHLIGNGRLVPGSLWRRVPFSRKGTMAKILNEVISLRLNLFLGLFTHASHAGGGRTTHAELGPRHADDGHEDEDVGADAHEGGEPGVAVHEMP